MASLSLNLEQDRAGWVTPEEQLQRLSLPIAQGVPECTRLRLIPPLVNEVAYRALDESVTNWHKALSRLGALPEKIPPLPEHIYQILDSKCPVYGDQAKADGTFRRIKETHFLALVPEEFGTLNRFEGEILRPYGEQKYLEEEHPLRFRYFWDEARQEHADVPFPRTHWVLMTRDVLPESRNKSWDEQVALMDTLGQKALTDYEIPTLQDSVAAIMTHMVATGEGLYPIGDKQNGEVYTYTRLQETTDGWHLDVGGFAPSGVSVGYVDYNIEDVGVAALQKFYGP